MRRGQEAARKGKWQEAYDAFKAAWGLVQDHAVACNLAQASLKLERRVEAAERARDCVKMLPESTKQEHRKRAEEGYEKARAAVAALEIDVEPEGADVLLDEKRIGTAPLPDEVFVEPGSHVVEAKHGTNGAVRQEVYAKQGEVRVVSLKVSAPSAAMPDPAPSGTQPGSGTNPAPNGDTGPTKPSEGIQPRTIALIVGGALSAITLGAGIVFKLKGSAAHDDAADALTQAKAQFGSNPCASQPGSTSSLCAEVRDKRDEGDSANQISNISFYAFGAFAVGTAAVFLFWPEEKSSTGVRATPWMTAEAGGVTLGGAF